MLVLSYQRDLIPGYRKRCVSYQVHGYRGCECVVTRKVTAAYRADGQCPAVFHAHTGIGQGVEARSLSFPNQTTGRAGG